MVTSAGNTVAYSTGSGGIALPKADFTKIRPAHRVVERHTCGRCGFKSPGERASFHICIDPETPAVVTLPKTTRRERSAQLRDRSTTLARLKAERLAAREQEKAERLAAREQEKAERLAAREALQRELGQTIIDRYNAGDPVTVIATDLHRKAATVKDVLEAAGIVVEKRYPVGRRGLGGGIGHKGGTLDGQLEEIVRLYYDEHLTTYEIGQRYGVTSSAIGYRLKRNGYEPRPNGVAHRGRARLSQRAVTPEQAVEVARLYGQGESMLALSKRFGCSENGIKQTLLREGVTIRPARRRATAAARPTTSTPPLEQRLAALGVSSRQIKEWAVEQGLLAAVARGRVSSVIVDAYAAAHDAEQVAA